MITGYIAGQNIKRLMKLISGFGDKKILVLGDLILDEYVWGNVERISPEAPVPILAAQKRECKPGGAANVASNIASLGGKVYLAGVVGEDETAGLLISELKKRNINTDSVRRVKDRRTTVKTRIITQRQQLVRIDWEDVDPISKSPSNDFIAFADSKLKEIDAIIIEDYGKGVVTPEILAGIVKLKKKKKNLIVSVDPKYDHFDYYKNVTVITPNRQEAENAIRYIKIKENSLPGIKYDKLSTPQDIEFAGTSLQRHLALDALLITLGEHGMMLFERGKKAVHIPTVAQEVFDVSGAGDTVIATFTMALACSASALEAAHIANCAAGIVVGKAGVAVNTQKDLIGRIKLEMKTSV